MIVDLGNEQTVRRFRSRRRRRRRRRPCCLLQALTRLDRAKLCR